MLASARPRYAAVLEGLRRIRRSARREALGRKSFRAVRDGVRRIASNACFGLTPLRCGFEGKGVGPTYLHKRGHSLLFRCHCDGSAGPGLHSQGTWGQVKLSRWRARGNRVFTFQCSLRPGPAAAWGSPPLRVLKRGPGRRKRKSRGPCLGSRSDAPGPVLSPPGKFREGAVGGGRRSR